MAFALRRLAFYLVAAWFAITLNFAIPRMMPGDPASTIFARFQGRLAPEALDALKASFGLTDAPLLTQYGTYLVHLFSGDLGLSVAYFPSPVSEVIGTGLGWTLLLAGTSVCLSFALGTLLGVLAAWRRGGRLDALLPPVLSFLGAFPYFWLAMAALWLFGYTLGWFPVRHAYGSDLEPGWDLTFLVDVVRHGLLPASTIVLVTLGGWMLSMRNTMLGVLGGESILYARARGLAPRTIMWRYAARNALLPSVTSFGMALGFVLGGSLLTEIVFAYPGQGYLLLQAVRTQDYPLMQGIFLAITLAVLAANWIVDVVTMMLDPRIR
jgi:peptide/nickel transport system permease protein